MVKSQTHTHKKKKSLKFPEYKDEITIHFMTKSSFNGRRLILTNNHEYTSPKWNGGLQTLKRLPSHSLGGLHLQI